MMEEVENVAASPAGDCVATTSTVDPRLHDTYKKTRPLVRIHELEAELQSIISSPSQQLKIVSIVGSGGLGKTTLAKALYDNSKGDFCCSAFVSVGRQPDLNKVLRNILIDLDNGAYTDLNMTILNQIHLIDELQHFLQSKRFLIVIDDIWDIPTWEMIKCALVESDRGSRIITTTRINSVAEKIGKVFKMMPLSTADSKELFYGRLVGRKGTISFDPLDEQYRKILQKCDGIPLALITVADFLADKPQEEWRKFNSIEFGHNVVENTRRVLQLSYHDLPAHLRRCLLYLSMYPEDHVIEKDMLVWRWIAEGFVNEEQEESLFKVGERYFNELINRSMIQPIEDEYTNMIYACHVHDMVLDLIRVEAEEHNFVIILNRSDDGQHLSYHKNNARIIAAQNRDLQVEEHDLGRIMCKPKVWSFNAFGCHISSMRSLSLSLHSLNVLCLEGCWLTAADYSDGLKHLEGLRQLKYLGFRETKIRYLPMQIGDLRFLQTLDLTDTNIEALPHSVTLLRQLKCLCCSGLILELPEGMGNLTSLEVLRLGTVAIFPNTANELSKLTELRVLRICIENLGDKEKEALVESLSKLKKIEKLVLIFDGPGSDQPCRHAISPSAFPKLQYLKMNNWLMYQLGAMPCLQYIELGVHVWAFNNANFDFHDFYILRYLRLLEKAHVAIFCGEAKTEDVEEAEATLRRVVQHHSNCPKLILERFGRCADDKLEDSYSSGSGATQRDVNIKQIREKLHHSRVAPEVMSLGMLKEITKGFSKKRKVGSGTFGTVYKGVQIGKEIAVKLLHRTQQPDYEEDFRKELENIRRLKHPNIIEVLGYCYEIKRELVEYEGRPIFADNIYRALCFEYMHNGSLQEHLYDEFHGLDWQTRYKIIRGTCEGLKYLHEGLKSPMYHLDLKPGNILLDKNMVAKLADFGLSKLVLDNKTRATSSFLGTRRYCPPEYIEQGYVSNKFDIFSLGVVMVEIIAGPEGYCKAAEMPSQEFIDHVQENWRKSLLATPGCTSLIYECRQVQRCLEIALECVSADRKQRPNIGDITSWLNNIENNTEKLAMMFTPQNETRQCYDTSTQGF